MSTTDAIGPAPNDGNIAAATAAKLTDPTDLELQEGRRQKELRDRRLYGPPKKPNGAGRVLSFPSAAGATENTGPTRSAGVQGGVAGTGPTGNAGPTGNTGVQGGSGHGADGSTGPTGNTGRRARSLGRRRSLGQTPVKRSRAPRAHRWISLRIFSALTSDTLLRLKSTRVRTPIIKTHHFDAVDRTGQQKFITDCGTAGFDLYFSPNPIKGTLHKKATKNDVLEARHLWIDLDPQPGEPLEAERATMLTLLTTNLPQGMPQPNRVIDSGRGYWGYWRLAAPQPVDGSQNDQNGPLTEAVECYGRGIEQAFGDRFADSCHNIDRVARLPGTVNTKTSRLAHVLHKYSHDTPHAIESLSEERREAQGTRGSTRGEIQASG